MGEWGKLKDVLCSPFWWLSVVFVGICINLISAFLKNILDEKLSKISKWWRNRSEVRKQKFESCVQALADDSRKLLLACYSNILRSIVTAILCLTLIGFIFISAQIKDKNWLFSAFVFFQFLICFIMGLQFGKILGLNSIIFATLSKIRDE